MSEDPALVTWWASIVECTSALARKRRDGALDDRGLYSATELLAELAFAWTEVPASDVVRDQAVRLLRRHPLRAFDALHLAAALLAAGSPTGSLDFVTLDARQAEAAAREGLRLLA
jgi:predicted nucleic acid-binding protein